MDSNHGLLQDKIFKWTGIVGGILTLSSLFIIFYSDLMHRNFDVSANGFSVLSAAISFPVGLAAATISLLGVWALVFRSEQTAKQINRTDAQIAESKKQNLFSNYFKHREEFLKIISSWSEEFNIEVNLPHEIYNMIFPQNSVSHVDVELSPVAGNEKFFELIKFRNEVAKNISNESIKKALRDAIQKNVDVNYINSDVSISGGYITYISRWMNMEILPIGEFDIDKLIRVACREPSDESGIVDFSPLKIFKLLDQLLQSIMGFCDPHRKYSLSYLELAELYLAESRWRAYIAMKEKNQGKKNPDFER